MSTFKLYMGNKQYTEHTNFSHKKLNKLPNLTKYTNLRFLNCSNNQLTELSDLPNSISL